MACFFLFGLWNIRGYAAKPIVVVLDPGHGGENLGAQYDGYTEGFDNGGSLSHGGRT